MRCRISSLLLFFALFFFLIPNKVFASFDVSLSNDNTIATFTNSFYPSIPTKMFFNPQGELPTNMSCSTICTATFATPINTYSLDFYIWVTDRWYLGAAGDLNFVGGTPTSTLGAINFSYNINTQVYTFNNPSGQTSILYAMGKGMNNLNYDNNVTCNLTQCTGKFRYDFDKVSNLNGLWLLNTNYEFIGPYSASWSNRILPVINNIQDTSLNLGESYSVSGSFSDPDSTSWSATVDYGDGNGTEVLPVTGNSFALNHLYQNPGIYSVTVNVHDDQEGIGTETTVVTVNAPPQITNLSNATINEGSTYVANGSFSDLDSIAWTGVVDFGDGSGLQSLPLSGTNFSLSHLYKDDGLYTIFVYLTDNQGATGTEPAVVIVNNVAASVGSITASSNPIPVNSSTTASASFSDLGNLDIHTASWDWGDGTITSGTVSEINGSGYVSDSHTYSTAGVYTITLTVTDNDGAISTQLFQYLSVYNPTPQGLFSGSRIFASPNGAYIQNPNLTGQVHFGITSKYSGTTPTANVSMNFKTADFNFVADSVTSLVTSGANATLRGTGTINGVGSYIFLVTGFDGHDSGGQDLIRFQIKTQTGEIVYDTQLGTQDTSTPTTPITGQITIN